MAGKMKIKNFKIPLKFIMVLTIVLISAAFLFNLLSLSQGYEVNKIKTDKKVVMLTFDDGPGIQDNAILDILKKDNIHATFFMTGNALEKSQTNKEIKEVVDRIIKEGHTIGNHTYNHDEYIYKTDQLIKELRDVNKLILSAYERNGISIEEKDVPVRLAYLQYFKGADKVQKELGINYFVRGYLGNDYEEVLAGRELILKQYLSHLNKGQIFVCHTRDYAVEWLPDLIEALKKQNYEFAAFREDNNIKSSYKNYGKLVF